ncbi:hypothetical protein TWF694_004826 [Orbilia ellipsospora]|uniref:Developmental regulatory protein wetA n=1 Tax=Orbilia ellipsospora TaxID=2528407 RepID=A0AAV9WTV4_9PEZI
MLSIDTGRSSTMSYPFQHPQHPQRPSGMYPSGFASSRINKADGIKPHSIPNLPTISTSLYEDSNGLASAGAATRASTRAQLLAGLRTAPRTPTGVEYNSVPATFDGDGHCEPHFGMGFLASKVERSVGHDGARNAPMPPFSSLPMSITNSVQPLDHIHGLQFNSFGGLPTPPTSNQYIYTGEQEYESKVYADLLARNFSALQQQQQLNQQMRVSQQWQALQQAQQMQSPITQTTGTPPVSPAIYSPPASNFQIAQPLYSLYPQAGNQFNYLTQQNRNPQGILPGSIGSDQSSVAAITSRLSLSSSPSTIDSATRTSSPRSSPPPTTELNLSNHATPAAKKTPTPPPLNGPAFRRGHKKCISLSGCTNTNPALADGGPKTSVPRFSNTPSTPMNSTFGGRGDHPIRQPRGPPAFEEIVAKPNAKIEGSKNFSSRQRRRALSKLVNAGIERRGTKTPTGIPMMSVSENDVVACFAGSEAQSLPSQREDQANSLLNKVESSRLQKRAGLAAPQLAVFSAEKRRSAVF